MKAVVSRTYIKIQQRCVPKTLCNLKNIGISSLENYNTEFNFIYNEYAIFEYMKAAKYKSLPDPEINFLITSLHKQRNKRNCGKLSRASTKFHNLPIID